MDNFVDLVCVACDFCKKETPQHINSHKGYFEVICTVCANLKRYGRIVVCVKCGNFVEAIGFTACVEKNRLLFISKPYCLHGQEIRQDCFVTPVIWRPEPVNHKEMCVPPICILKS